MTHARRLAAVALVAILSLAHAQSLPRVNAGFQAAGTFSWIVHGMKTFGFDTLNGIDVVGTTYASKQATELALRGGEADVTVDDFLGAVLLRSRDVAVTGIFPYAKAVGGLVVPTGSDITSVADLRGRTIAAGSLRDKSLLILRALSVSQYGFDVQEASEVVAASPPLMLQLVASREVDAALPFWHFVARIEAAGTGTEILSVTDMLEALGLPGDLPNLMVLARDDMPAAHKTAFIAAMMETVETMKSLSNDDPFWQSILDLGLYTLPNQAQFPAVIDRWRLGTPDAWTEESIAGLTTMVELLVELAGEEVVGIASVPRDSYSTAFNPR
ncbi:MAG: PhnD/SsuA/transferrin family substrate-binding protein [bacterium]|nr:PhnD/SsuA/transferrin family substrate-binding protein [bacterium]